MSGGVWQTDCWVRESEFFFATQSRFIDFQQQNNLCIPLAFHWPHCGFSKKWSNAPLCDAVVWVQSVAPYEGNPLKTELKPKCVISAVSGLRGAYGARYGRPHGAPYGGACQNRCCNPLAPRKGRHKGSELASCCPAVKGKNTTSMFVRWNAGWVGNSKSLALY